MDDRRFSQRLRLKKNWGNTYRANLRDAIEALPKFVPMPPLSMLTATPAGFDPAPFIEVRAAVNEANEALDSIRAALVLLQATPDYEFDAGESLAAHEQEVIARFLERTGQYVTNDASREAAIAEAVSAALTQPTTVQQAAALTDEQIRDGFRDYDKDLVARHRTPWQIWRDSSAWTQAALKGMQPGERKEGAE